MANLQSAVLKVEVAVGSRTQSYLWVRVRVEQEYELAEVGLWFILGFICFCVLCCVSSICTFGFLFVV
jgi:hypothetical protein